MTYIFNRVVVCGLLLAFGVGAAEPTLPSAVKRVDARGDPLPEGAIARLGTTRFRPGEPIRRIETTRDDRYLLTVGASRIAVWEASTGKLLRSWNAAAPTADLAPDGERIALSLDGEHVEIFSWATKDPSDWSIPVVDVGLIRWSPDGKLLAVLDNEGEVRVHEIGRGKTPRRRYAKVRHFCFSADSSAIITARENGGLDLHRLSDETASRSLRDESNNTEHCVGLAPLADGTILRIDEDDRFSLWDFKKQTVSPRFKGSKAFAADGKTHEVFAVDAGSAAVYDFTKSQWVRRIADVGAATAMAFNADRLYVAGPGPLLRVWDRTTRKELFSQAGHRSEITGLALADDGKTLFSGSAEGVRVWDLSRYAERIAARRDGFAASLSLAPDNRRLVIGGSEELRSHELLPFDAAKPISEPASATIETKTSVVTVLAYAPDGKLIAYADGQKRVVFADPADLKQLGSIPLDAEPLAASFAPVTHHFAALTRDGRLHLGSIDPQWTEVWKNRVQRSSRGAVTFSADGLLIAVGGAGRVNVLETVTGRAWHGFDRQLGDGDVRALAFSPDSRLLAVGHAGSEGIVRLWEVLTGKELATFRGHAGGTGKVAFTSDGGRLISAGSDSTLLVWDATTSAGTESAAMKPADAWELLDGDDGKLAYRAMGCLLRAGNESVAVVENGIRQARIDRTRYGEWIRRLDSDDFKIRKSARSALEKAGARAVPSLTDALQGDPKPESARLVRLILEGFEEQGIRVPSEGLFGEPLRTIRAVHVLEHVGGKEATAVLESLAADGDDRRVRSEALASLGRMKR